MLISYHRDFKKAFKKLPARIQDQFCVKLETFLSDPFAPELNNHTLKGKYKDCRSINVTGHIRAIYTRRGLEVIFLILGSHSELYG